MDGFRKITIKLTGSISLCAAIIACGPQKSVQSVMSSGGSSSKTGINCQTNSLRVVQNRFIVTWEDGHRTVEKSENKNLFAKTFVAKNLAKIKHVENDQVVVLDTQAKILASAEVLAAPSNTWGQAAIGVDAVHSQGVKGQGVLVAVVDTPVDYTHPLLKNRMVAGWDFVSNSASASAPHDHATHIAGVIAAEEGGAVDGLAPQAHVMGVSFMDASGSGVLSDAINAMEYAADHGAKVINNSWGGPQCSTVMQDAMNTLSNRGVLLMVAAGNDGVDIERSPTFPASFSVPLQVTVAASTVNSILAAFSNTSWNLVHLAAPGQDIYSTIPGGYGFMSGTSMATPFVTGAAALLLSAKPSATGAQIKQALLAGVTQGPYRVETQGLLNVQRSLDEIRRLVP